MLDNTSADTGLDAIQLAALRKCDDVAFFHREGRSYIRAIKRMQPSAGAPFAQDVIVEIECATRWDDYSREFATSAAPVSFDAFEMCGNYSDSAWRTIASLLRKGDRLMLHWSKDCMGPQSDLCRAGFHLDRLSLAVGRGTDQRLNFHIDDSVCLGTNTARMIRNVRHAPEYHLAC